MKYKIITSLFGLLFIFFAYGQTSSLPVKKVMEKFFATYNVRLLPYEYIEFEKRKADWYVKTLGRENNEFVKGEPILFYSSKLQSYRILPFERNTANEPINFENYVPESLEYEYDVHPYYGYPGWFKDVIREYNGRKDLTDKELYSLARAYSNLAMAPVTNQLGDVVPEDAYRLPFRRDAFSEKQLQEYSVRMDSAIAKYRQLSQRSPEFQTRVGDSRDKYANEIMFKFHILLSFSQKGFDQMVLPKKLYKDSILGVARSYLKACPPKSIFVSMGDNDFYPLLYLQHTEGFRKDVYIINYNLLGVDKFIYRLSHPQNEAAAIAFAADTSLYKGTNNEIFFIDRTNTSITVTEIINFLRTEKGDENGRKTLSTGYVELPWKNGNKFSTKIDVSLDKSMYLLKNQWILLDILNNLNGRVLCLPVKLEDQLKGLSPHLSHDTNDILYRYNN